MSVSAAFETVHPVYFLEVSLQLPRRHVPPPFPRTLTASGACARMTSLTLCISIVSLGV